MINHVDLIVEAFPRGPTTVSCSPSILFTAIAGKFSTTKKISKHELIFKIKPSNQYFDAKTTHAKLRRIFCTKKFVSYVGKYAKIIARNGANVT